MFILTRLLLCCLMLAAMSATADQAEPEKTADTAIPIEELRLFSEVFHQIRQHYVSDISDRDLLQYAIEGMLQGLDPHSAFLDREAFLSLQENTSGEFGGVGVEVTTENGLLKVIAPIDDTPAQKAGIQAGDIIVRIDDKSLKGMPMRESVDLMRGPEGSDISLTILREDSKKPIEITLQRAIIHIDSVKSRLIGQHYGYLRIAQFQNNTAQEAADHLQALLDQAEQPLRGLVLDLRNNPGGVMNSAVDLTDLFISDGLIVYTEGRHADERETFYATENTLLPEQPIVVLVNNGSASASEIVAGALQDHQRALILGTKSFGKGSVQTILPLPQDNAIKLTTARYYTPGGRSIQARGIEPDIIARSATLTFDEQGPSISESSLAGHIDNGDNVRQTAPDNKNSSDETLQKDYQLYEAINLLKAMHFSTGTEQQ